MKRIVKPKNSWSSLYLYCLSLDMDELIKLRSRIYNNSVTNVNPTVVTKVGTYNTVDAMRLIDDVYFDRLAGA